jgi:hypothetical protein
VAGTPSISLIVLSPLVVQQVAYELEHWDGSRTDRFGRRSSSIELWMDIRQRRAVVSLLARKPPGFPDVIQSGELVFAAEGEGWYQPIPLGRGDGGVLADGLSITAEGPKGAHVLKLRPGEVFALTPSEEFTGFVSNGALRSNARCAVLCRDTAVPAVGRFLERLTNSAVNVRTDDTLPEGWSLFTDIRPIAVLDPPDQFHCLRIESDAALISEGGLSTGRRWTWLEGALPRVRAIGDLHGSPIRIDGSIVQPDDDGYLPLASAAPAGQHLLSIGGTTVRRITVLTASISPACRPWRIPNPAALPVLLPAGRWRIFGSLPGQEMSAELPLSGDVVRPEFPASWAMNLTGGRGVTVLHLHAGDRPSAGPAASRAPAFSVSAKRYGAAATWAEAIYQANVRRPRLSCGHGCPSPQLSAEWRRIVEVARTVKRKARVRR